MKITKRIILIILSVLLIFSAVACGKTDNEPDGTENTPPVEQTPPQEENPPDKGTQKHEKIYCNATLESEFTDNEIIISVFPEYNRTEYNIDDFSAINCISIKELWGDVPEGELGRILMLTLEKHSKQNVLDAIKILEKRPDIYCAEPNFIMHAE